MESEHARTDTGRCRGNKLVGRYAPPPHAQTHPGAALTAICGRNRDRAEAMAQKYAITQVFTDYRAMLEDGNLHALVVVTPDDLHYAITRQALAADLHVLCEKPLALTAGQARSMYEKAEAGGRKHMVLFTYRWLPHYRYVAGYGRAAQYRWRFDRQRSNGSLGDLGSHMIDLARWYVGDVAKVSGHLATFVERPGADGAALEPANDAALLAAEFANGATERSRSARSRMWGIADKNSMLSCTASQVLSKSFTAIWVRRFVVPATTKNTWISFPFPMNYEGMRIGAIFLLCCSRTPPARASSSMRLPKIESWRRPFTMDGRRKK